MSVIFVRAVAGRKAYDAPRGGKRIPNDEYVPVKPTPWINRLLRFHGDIELKPETKPTPKEKPAKSLGE